jgi:hypothetical protein
LASTNRAGARREHGAHHAARGPAGADEEHAGAAQLHAEVALEIGDEARAIGVVRVDRAVALREEVGRAGEHRALALHAGKLERLDLERQRHVGSAPAAGEESLHRAREIPDRRQHRVYSMLSPSSSAKRAWITGERLCAMGLPKTA